MSGMIKTGILSGILSAALLSSCGVRDEDLDLLGENGAGGLTLGTDTSYIAGYWDSFFNFELLITDDGEWNFIRPHATLNCDEFEVLTVEYVSSDSNTGYSRYILDDDGVLTTFDALVENSSMRYVEIEPVPATTTYSAITGRVPEDLNRCTAL